jgi:hypothetical protein
LERAAGAPNLLGKALAESAHCPSKSRTPEPSVLPNNIERSSRGDL